MSLYNSKKNLVPKNKKKRKNMLIPYFSGEIKDWQLAASSVVSRAIDPNCAVKYARLHAPGKRAWCPEHVKQGEWILVDLGVESELAGVMTQGRDGHKQWVTHFHLSYSLDAYRYKIKIF
jgi:hypothetical protein